MSRDDDTHLSREEILCLVEEEFEPSSVSLWTDREIVSRHAALCGQCRTQLQAQRSVQSSLRSLLSSVALDRTADCPAEAKWLPLAAGLCPGDDVAALLEHAAGCDYCGPLLREITQSVGPEVSAQEKKMLSQLASPEPARHKRLAQRLADASQPLTDDALQVVPRSRGFRGWMRWGFAAAVAVLIAVGGVAWYEVSQPSLAETNRLIAQAYTEQRPFEMRLEGAAYGPVRQQRGASHLGSPQALKEAKERIARALEKRPDDPGWLQAKGRVELLEGNVQAALEDFRLINGSRAANPSIQVDLATAYFALPSESENLQAAVALLTHILTLNPSDRIARFNRALVLEKQHKYRESESDWQKYLGLTSEQEWDVEARRHLDKIEHALRKSHP